MEAGGYITPSDSEDETSNVRQFMHDYFEFEINLSSMLIPYEKLEGTHSRNKTELLLASRITGPVCVTPDLENENNRAFLAVRGMKDWANMFKEWVNEPHAVAHQETPIDLAS